MDVTVTPSPLSGRVSAIPSKSDAHRLLICAAFADKPTKLRCKGTSEDIEATCRCLSALGTKINREGEYINVVPAKDIPASPHLDCGESGSTLRFMLPVCAAVCSDGSFSGHGRLPQRPLSDLVGAMEANGVSFSAPALPFSHKGRLSPGVYSLAGNVSSQYVTGLMLGLSLLTGDSEIVLTTPLESAAYIDITTHALSRFGAAPERTEKGWRISGKGRFTSPGELEVDGDWSNSAFFLVSGAGLSGLDTKSPQGDKEILSVLKDLGAKLRITPDGISADLSALSGTTVDVSGIPDALPILSVAAATASGETHFVNAARLRLKESDRLATTAAMLENLGIRAVEHPDGLTVYGGSFSGGTVDGAGDHRIVMAAAIAATFASAPVTIKGAEAVNKSYPTFFEDFKSLGGIANGI